MDTRVHPTRWWADLTLKRERLDFGVLRFVSWHYSIPPYSLRPIEKKGSGAVVAVLISQSGVGGSNH
jgi:hypothetical protein